MDKEISEGQQIIKKYWNNEDKFYQFCNCWIKEINTKYFSSNLPKIQPQIIPMSIFSILYTSHTGASYEGNPPLHTISIGVDLLSKSHPKIRAVLLHELVHVWESIYSPQTAGVQTNIESPNIPGLIKEAIKKVEKRSVGSSFQGHSSAFIEKLCEICETSRISLALSAPIDLELMNKR